MIRTFLELLDLGGTFVFALSGAAAGVKYRLDLFGVLVLSFAAAGSGGILRDLLIGAVPPDSIRDWRYIAVSTLAGLSVLYWGSATSRLRGAVLVFDAAGLALFSVSGTLKALDHGLGLVAAPLLGMLTGVGGGMVRDLLVSEVPAVLRSEIYAVAALAGSVVVVAGAMLHLPSMPVAIAGAALCFGLRMISVRRGWRLPVPHPEEEKS